ncbi:hypothetical protein DPMN_193714 [Dreissena polymorpha]|uniref:Uncharacterized protein n=1 Tax=Dreissena polymorpha TaxID=45954 RepID=A0A9D4BD39_DREPO|nr:hypothetical protein DPMN_193714 [Dreissena polymorpha]
MSHLKGVTTRTLQPINDPNALHETAHAVEHLTSRITLNIPLTSGSLSNNQRTRTSNSANTKPEEPLDRLVEMGSNKEDKSYDS